MVCLQYTLNQLPFFLQNLRLTRPNRGDSLKFIKVNCTTRKLKHVCTNEYAINLTVFKI